MDTLQADKQHLVFNKRPNTLTSIADIHRHQLFQTGIQCVHIGPHILKTLLIKLVSAARLKCTQVHNGETIQGSVAEDLSTDMPLLCRV